jgi:transcriptional regulator with XRE-family HTH domain
MVIGDRLRALRDHKKLSQGDIEKRTGLFRCYISRVENNHTVPAIVTLEKMARAMEVPVMALASFTKFGAVELSNSANRDPERENQYQERQLSEENSVDA